MMGALLSLSEAVDRHVRDAQSIALEGFTHLIPCRAQDHPSATPSADELRVLRNMHARQ